MFIIILNWCTIVYRYFVSNIQWLEKDFLGYLEGWESSINSLKDVPNKEKKTMCLSPETLDGIKMTG